MYNNVKRCYYAYMVYLSKTRNLFFSFSQKLTIYRLILISNILIVECNLLQGEIMGILL